jgi:hypothetical protein
VRTVSCAVFFGLLFVMQSFAQERPLRATKFDEFGDVYPTDAAARLDNFAIQLQQQPSANGFLIGYRSFRDLPGISGRRIEWMRNYLINLRGIDADRIKTVDGGEAPCLVHEFWIVPLGAAPVPRADAYAKGFDNLEVARKFDEYRWDAPHDASESFSVDYAGGLEGFADALGREPRSYGYIIAYSEYEFEPKEDQKGPRRRARVDPPGTASKYLKQLKDDLVKTYRITSSRLRLIEGGYRDSRAVEFWIVPRGAYAPVPTPNIFPKRRPLL